MIAVYLETSCSEELRAICAEGDGVHLAVVETPAACDVALFQREDHGYIRSSPVFAAYPEKCIAVTEWDKPAHFLPTICSSNTDAWYARGRAQTMHYPFARRARWNADVTDLANAAIDKRYLYSFIGKSSSLVRKHLLRQFRARQPPDVLIEDSSARVTNFVDYQDDTRRRYAEIMAASHYVLCPRGWGTGSVRLFEACEMGIAPVILADGWPPIAGLDWSFALFVPERRVTDIDAIVRAHAAEAAERGVAARKAYAEHFAPDVFAQRLAEAIERLRLASGIVHEPAMRWLYPAVALDHLTRKLIRKGFVSYRP